MQFEQLRALAAIVDEGTFEAAADVLGVTPSAVSQRIKALEASVGQVVVRRSVPCEPTEAGVALVQMARQVQVLREETLHRLGAEPTGRARTPVAVNADSLATWFVPVLDAAAQWTDTLLDLHVEDQDHSSALLRRGDVLGAVTADPTPVHGCTVEPLGSMRYLPVISPRLLERHGSADLERLPMIQYNAKDDLQRQALSRWRRTQNTDSPEGEAAAEDEVLPSPPTHTVPSFDGFHAAIRSGLGWGMLTEHQWRHLPDDGSLTRVPGLADVQVGLYWQSWTLRSTRLERLRAAVLDAAAQHLLPLQG